MTSVNQDNGLKRSYNEMNIGVPVNGSIPVNGSQVNVSPSIGSSVNGTPVNANNSTGGIIDSPASTTTGIPVGGNTPIPARPQQQQRMPTQSPKVPLQKLTPQQIHQQQLLHARQNLRNLRFAETTEELLKKYEKLPPSMEFHIHENHYRFGNQDGIISGSNPMVKEFLEYVAREEIPHAIVEVLRDGGIRLYEGCLILKIFDHRNAKNVSVAEGTETVVKKLPRTFRTVLKPTSLSLFYDLLTQADYALQRFTDSLGLSMESEILAATKRNLDLAVPLNPYKGVSKAIIPESEFPKVIAHGKVIHNHRVESSDPNSKAFKPFRELHEDSVPPHQSTNYEQFMTFDDGKSKATGEATEPSSFTRLRFLEQYRVEREKSKQQSLDATRSFANGLKFGNNNSQAANANISQMQQAQLQNQRIKQLQQQTMNQQQGGMKGSPLQHQQSLDSPNAPGMTPSALGDQTSAPEKKPKKPRKPTKKQLAAQAATSGQTPLMNTPNQPLQQIPPQPQPGQYADKTLPGLNANFMPGGNMDLLQQQKQAMMMMAAQGATVNGVTVNGEPPAKKKRGTYKKKSKAESAAAGAGAQASGSSTGSSK